MTFLPSLRRDNGRQRDLFTKTIDGTVPRGFSPEQKAIFTNYAAKFYSTGRVVGEPEWTVERAVAQAYGRVVYVMKSVNTISGDSSSLFVRMGQRENNKWDPSATADILNDEKANPLENGRQMRKRLSAQVLLSPYGGFVERSKTNGGRAYRYDLLPPHRTRIVPVTEGEELVSHVEVQRPTGGYYRVEWEDVLWFRDPHPLDPFRGVTPLEAAGMSVELDYMARLYNVSFLRNDGRPGGVLAVRGSDPNTPGGGDISPEHLDRLESRFGKGPMEAGKIHAITGEISYQDFGNNPRDMQYVETAGVAKHEQLLAFGAPESVLGYAADRTFDNAKQEKLNYWTTTMSSHNKIIEDGLADERERDGQDLWLDTSEIDVLQEAQQAKLAVAREEVAAGLRSIYSYAVLAGIEDIEDNAHTRALYVAAGKTPIPAKDEDAVALGMGPIEGTSGTDTSGTDTSTPPAIDAAPASAQIESPAAAVAAIAATPASPAEAVSALQTKDINPTAAAPRSARPRRTLRVVREGETKESARGPVSSHDPETAGDLERALTTALTDVLDATLARTVARLDAPKTRKHTRHWTPEFEVDTRMGVKAVDAAKAVDDQSVEEQTDTAVSPLVKAAALAAAVAVAQDLTGKPPSARVTGAVAAAATTMTSWIATVMGDLARGLVEAINHGDQQGLPMGEIRATVLTARDPLAAKIARFAGDAAHSVVEGARDAAATALSGHEIEPSVADQPQDEPRDIRRQWRSKRDADVRPSHRVADGQEVGPTVPFIVGGSLLRYPRDPAAPLRETAGCRCTVDYFVTDGVVLTPMAGKALTAAVAADA